MTVDEVAERLKEIAPHVWYRGCLPTDRFSVKQGFLHTFVVSDRPHTEDGYHGHPIRNFVCWAKSEDDEDVDLKPEDFDRYVQKGKEYFEGARARRKEEAQ